MLEKLPPVIGQILEGVRPGLDKLIWANPAAAGPETVVVLSEAFADSQPIPAKYTQDGDRLSPPLAWSDVPRGAVSMILVIEDADSPTPAPAVHALVYDLDPHQPLAEGALPSKAGPGQGVSMGKNSFRAAQYLPPDPPPGHGPHRYVVQVYALDYAPALSGEPEKHDVIEALRGHVIGRGRLIGVYQRDKA